MTQGKASIPDKDWRQLKPSVIRKQGGYGRYQGTPSNDNDKDQHRDDQVGDNDSGQDDHHQEGGGGCSQVAPMEQVADDNNGGSV